MGALKAGLVTAFVAGGIALTLTSTGCSSASEVRQVFMALDGAGNRPRDTFFPDTDIIYCDVIFSGYSNDQTVDVSFLQVKGEDPIYDGSGNDTQPVSRLWGGAEIAATEGIQTIGFTLNHPFLTNGGGTLPYPVGSWKCLVTVNGESAGESDFTIEYPKPDCPATGGAYDGLPCVGNKVGSQCPIDGNYQVGGTDCTCQMSPTDPTNVYARAWVCQ